MTDTAVLSASFAALASARAQADIASEVIGKNMVAATAVMRGAIRPPKVMNSGITANSVNFTAKKNGLLLPNG
jgi:hypothetical protein